MNPLSLNKNEKAKMMGRFLLYVVVNIFACYFIPRFLAWAHYVINGLFIPNRLSSSVTRPNQDMTPLYSLMLLIIAGELTGLLIGLYQFNKRYSHYKSGKKSLLTVQLTTVVVAIIVTSLTIKEFWYLLKKL